MHVYTASVYEWGRSLPFGGSSSILNKAHSFYEYEPQQVYDILVDFGCDGFRVESDSDI